MLYTAPRVLPTWLYTAADLAYKKRVTYFIYFDPLATNVESKRKVEELMSAYGRSSIRSLTGIFSDI